MYIRITFDNQDLTNDELNDLEKTVADKIDFEQLYKKEDGKINTLYSWQETADPNDPKLAEGKYKLVKPVDMVRLSSTHEFIVDMDYFFQKHPNIKIKMRGLPKSIEKDYTSVIEHIISIQDKLEKALKAFDGHVEFNEKCDVHISNLGLLNVNQLGYAVDKCTEELQVHLNKGWRILAVCPQPNQRRPDYILGRYNPDEENVECIKF